MDRRKVLSTGSAAAVAALAGCATGGAGAPTGGAGAPTGGGKTVFTVAQPTLPIVGTSEVFPVRRIYCIGRNYAAHAREMGSDPNREPPFFFQKPSDAIQFVAIGTTADHPYPPLTRNYHYEIELVAALGKGGRNVSPDQALALVYGYAIGLDMTRRDLQRAMGDEKKPWEIGKSFDRSAPMGPLHRVADVGHFTKGAITLKVNGVVKQSADLDMMTWSVAEQISKLSQAFELFPGDLIYSGTPENVGPVVPGDVMQGSIAGLPTLDVRVTGTKNA
jgi:fumarylpyruvate hydrolase